MGSKIYVGGLPYSTTEQQLSDLFAVHGAVTSSRIITDKFTGQSRGFGFVEMSSDSEAQAAITALNGTELGGRTLTVNEARPQEPRTGGGGGGGQPRYFLPRIAHQLDACLGLLTGPDHAQSQEVCLYKEFYVYVC
jgi:RNA recognition motif-containing protein